MKRSLLLITTLIALLLSACAGTPEATPTPTSMADEISTIIAQVMESQATPVPPAAKPEPTATLLPTATIMTKPSPSPAVPAQSVSYSSAVCDNAVYLSDITIPDYTETTAGESFTKTWSLQNTGTCAWTETYTVNFISGSSMSGESTTIGEAVYSGGTVQVSVDLIAPTTAGTYTGYWQMANDSGTTFGASFFVLIVVPSSTTSTPTSTSVYTATATDTTSSTATATPTATATTAPASTSTSTPTATATSTTEVTTD